MNDSAKTEIGQFLNSGRSLLKWCYLGREGAQAWSEMRNDQGFAVGNREQSALQNILIEAKHRLSNDFDVVHIGPGNGIEIPWILKELTPTPGAAYWSVDISEDLLNLVRKNHEKLFESKGLRFELICQDLDHAQSFESTMARARSFVVPRQACWIATGEGTLLANTQVLQTLKKNMRSGDLLVTTIDRIGDDPQKTCSEYDAQETRRFILGSLEIAKSVGVVTNLDGEFLPTTYDSKSGILRCAYQLKDSHHTAVLLESFKPANLETARQHFERAGFSVIHAEFNANGAIALICE